MAAARHATRLGGAALLAGAAFFWVGCGEKTPSREQARARGDSAQASSAAPAPPEWWGDLASSVLGHKGLYGFGATWNEVTATLGPPGRLRLETEDDDTLFIAEYLSDEAEYAGSIRPLLFEFRSASGGVRRLTRAYWQVRDEHGDAVLPRDLPGRALEVAERLQSWGNRLEEVEAALGPALPDTLPAGETDTVGGILFATEIRRRYPGLVFRFDKDGTLFGVEWNGPTPRIRGWGLGATRYQAISRLGLPWVSTNDPGAVGREKPDPAYPVWRGRGDSTATWLYGVSEDPLDFLVLSLKQDRVTSVSWWSAGLAD
jgi:hypothetical protein